MQLINGSHRLKNITLKNPVVTIGNFDGLHIGHQMIIKSAVQRARVIGGTSIVYTFDPHPVAVLAPHRAPPIITTFAEKAALLKKRSGVDLLVRETFTRKFAALTSEEFIRTILYERFHPREILVGHDYSFGKNREGSVRLLKKLGKELGFTVWVMRDIRIDNIPVRSTTIRNFIRGGAVYEASRLLGRPYALPGTVVRGLQRGIGFPTANLAPDKDLVPANGIYAIQVETPCGKYGGVVNIGTCPTFGENRPTIEAHLFHFGKNLYGKKIALQFIERLRGEKKFRDAKTLAAQIEKDIRKARKIFKALTG
jgi:riboflavin kinase/FMN adenylyltransferase